MTSYGELARRALLDESIASRLRDRREVDLRHGRDQHSLGIVIVPSLEENQISLVAEHRAAAEASGSQGYKRPVDMPDYIDCHICGQGEQLSPPVILGLVLRAYGFGDRTETRDERKYFAVVDRRRK